MYSKYHASLLHQATAFRHHVAKTYFTFFEQLQDDIKLNFALDIGKEDGLKTAQDRGRIFAKVEEVTTR
jgi:hypothetical protein